MTARDRAEDAWAAREAEVEFSKVGWPVDCCGEWPECPHVLEAVLASTDVLDPEERGEAT